MNGHATLNRIYRLVWNEALSAFVPTSELTRARRKTGRSATRRLWTAAALLSAAGAAMADPAPTTLPTGGQVVRGDALLHEGAARLDVTQLSNRTVIDWQRFNIGRDATVQFSQPSASSVALNRVLSSDPSEIFGRLIANGQVFLSNPNGVLFGAGSRVDVGGLVATSMQIDADDFMAGRYRFTGGTGSVINMGELNAADGGVLALMAPEVRNEGVLSARLGTVALAAGEAVTLQLGDDHVSVQVDPAAVDVLVENRHLIAAPGGQVILSASASERLRESAIAGETGATRLVTENGVARLINVEGTVQAAHISVDGGETGLTRVAGTLDVSSSGAQGGDILVTGDKVLVDAGAVLSANGRDGGAVLIGGDERGANPNVRNADRVFVDAGAVISADGGRTAAQVGNGGKVIVYSQTGTQTAGALSARGGSSGGNGGFIETSGGWLDVGATPNASAAAGQAGHWLIDPYNITIQAAGSTTSAGSGPNWSSTADSAIVTTSNIESALNSGTSVTITTGSGGSQGGDIVVSDAITKTAGGAASLTLTAHRDVVIHAAIGSTNNALSLTFDADSDNDSAGAVVLNNNLTTLGGSINFLDGTVIGGNSGLTLSSGGGNVVFGNQVMIGNSNGVTITTGGGNVTFASLIDSGNSYTFVNSNLSWSAARTAAASGTGTSVGDTYLATITSPLEMSRAAATAGYTGSWLGGADTGTEGTWRWVTGPEGLENGGLGRIINIGNRSGLPALLGYAGYNGAYVNWNASEPNDYNNNEDALQLGFGAAGQWNDLPTTGTLLPYVRETVLAPSPLTISAGSGNITFNGDIGVNKSLGTLTLSNTGNIFLNANTVNVYGNINLNSGGAAIIGAANNPVLFADDGAINFARNIEKNAGADAALSLRADTDILLTGSADISSSSNRLDVTLNSNRDNANGGGVFLDTGSSITSNGGNVVLGGGTTPSSTAAVATASTSRRAIFLTGAQIDAGAGNVTMTGLGDNVGVVSAAPGIGVDFVSSTVQTTTGSISISGTGSGGSNNTNLGISVFSGSVIRSTSGGNVTLTGTASASGTFAAGVNIESGSTVAALNGGAVNITGVGSSNGTGALNHGVYIQSSSSVLASGAGNLSITGTAGAGASGIATLTGSNVIGNSSGYSGNIYLTTDTLDLANLSVRSTGALFVRPLSTGTSIGIGDSSSGTLNLSSAELGLFQDGFASLTFGRSDGTGDIDARSYTFTDALNLVSAAGDGDITVNGDLRNTGGGITLEAGDSIGVATTGDVTTQGGAITFISDRDASGAGAMSVASGAALTSNGGNITLRGGSGSIGSIADPTSNAASFLSTLNSTGAMGSGSAGILLSGATLAAGGGNIELRGVGAGSYRGVQIDDGSSVTTTGAGTIAIHGAGGSSGNESDGVRISTAGTALETQNGELRVQGLGRGGNNSQGVAVQTPATSSSPTLLSSDGNIVVRGASTATGTNDQGVLLETQGSARTTGSGNVDFIGRGSGTGTGVGVLLYTGAVVQTTGGGDISMTGYGTTSGTLSNNEGVKVDGSLVEVQSGPNADLTLLGFGGTGQSYNIGVNVRVNGIVRMGAAAGGLMSISGTGGNGSVTGNWGVLAEGDGIYESLGAAPILITGVGGTGSDNPGIRVTSGSLNRIGAATMTGDITLVADAMDLQGSGVLTVQSSGALVVQPYSVNTSIGLGNSSAGTLNLDTTELSRLTNGFSQITIGRADGTGAINLTSATFSDSLRLLNTGAGSAGISVGGALNLGANDLWLASQGAVTQSASITANRLLLTGGGSFTLTNASNTVSTLAGLTSGALNFRNSGSLTVGPVVGGGVTYNGVQSTGGAITLYASGLSSDLILDRAVSAAGTGTTVQLSAGRNFINNAGAAALDAGSGRWLVWSTNPAGDVRGGLDYDFKHYGASYGVTTPAQSNGNGLLYSMAAPTITASLIGSTSRVYDGTTSALLSGGNFSFSGAIDGDTISLSTPTTGTFDTKNAGTNKTVNATGLALTSAIDGDATVYGYQLASTSVSAAIGEITPATLTAGLTGSVSKTYDGNDAATLASANYTLSGVIGSDSVALNEPTSGTYDSPNAGTGKTVSVTGVALSGSDANNYVLGSSSVSGGVGSITPKGLSITADDASRPYGSANPTFSASYSGFVNGENASALGGTLAFATPATLTSNVGTYAITPSGATSSNYSISFVPGTLTVSPAALMVTADNASRLYGSANPAFSASFSGFMNGEDPGALAGTLAFATSATATSNVGTYAITPSGLSATNYSISFVPGALSVNPAALVITANDASRLYGAANPGFSARYSGFVNGENANALGGALSFVTPATVASNVGMYAVTPGGATSSNYAISFVPGTLAVNQAPLIVTADDLTQIYGDPDPQLTVTIGGAGLRNGDTLSGSLFAPNGAIAIAGTHTIEQGTLAASSNYSLTFVPGTLTVQRAPLLIVADDKTRLVFADNPALTATVSGLRYNDDRAVISGLTLNTAAERSSSPGAYEIHVSGASASNYDITYVDGTLDVLPGSAIAEVPHLETIPSAQAVPATSTPSVTSSSLSAGGSSSSTTSIVRDGGISGSLQAESPTGTSMSGSFIAVEALAPLDVSGRSQIQFELPADTFRHSDAHAAVVISVTLADGSPLPSWLSYDAATGTLSGTTPPDFAGLEVTFIARDESGGEASTTIRLQATQLRGS